VSAVEHGTRRPAWSSEEHNALPKAVAEAHKHRGLSGSATAVDEEEVVEAADITTSRGDV
jgi:hypothetical protein